MKKVLSISLLLLAVNKGVFALDPVLIEEENSNATELETQTSDVSKDKLLEEENPSIIEVETQTADKSMEAEKSTSNAGDPNLISEISDAQSDVESVSSNDINKSISIPNLYDVPFKFDGVSEETQNDIFNYISNECKGLLSNLLEFSHASQISVNISNKPQQETNKDQDAGDNMKNIQQMVFIGGKGDNGCSVTTRVKYSAKTCNASTKNVQQIILVRNNGDDGYSIDTKVKYSVKIGSASADLYNVGNNINFDIVIDEGNNQSLSDVKEALTELSAAVAKDVRGLYDRCALKEVFWGTPYCTPFMCWYNLLNR